MARLTPEQWLAAKADFEIAGLSVTEVAQKYGCAKSAVSMKAKTQGWKLNKTERAQDKKIKAVIALAEVETETEQKLNTVERAVFDKAVADDVKFRLQSDARMQQVEDVAMALLGGIGKATDAKAVMETLRIHREARLGKAGERLPVTERPEVVEVQVVDARA